MVGSAPHPPQIMEVVVGQTCDRLSDDEKQSSVTVT